MELNYPIGKYRKPAAWSEADRQQGIADIGALPRNIRDAVAGLSDAQLDTRYRPDGWTVRQVVHHVADSHLNAYCRIRFALTESEPTIKPYNEATWAELEDARTMPVTVSLTLIESAHARWGVLMKSLTPPQFARTFNHPENGLTTIDGLIALYSWHGRHHTAHITELRKREGWT